MDMSAFIVQSLLCGMNAAVSAKSHVPSQPCITETEPRHGLCNIKKSERPDGPPHSITQRKVTKVAYAGLLLFTAALFIRPQAWAPLLRGFSLFGFGLMDFIMGFALLAWFAEIGQKGWKFKKIPQNWLMLGLVSAVFMSHMRHTNLGDAISAVGEFGKVFIYYILIASLLTSTRRVKGLISMMVIGCLFMSIHGIMQAHTGAGFGGAAPLIQHGELIRVRAFGTFHDPNDLALILVTCLPFLFGEVLSGENTAPWRFLNLLPIPFLLYCIYLTNSRGGWLALAVMALVFCLIYLRKKFLGIVLGILAVPVVFMLGPSRVGSVTSTGGAVEGRLLAWGYGNRMLKRFPLFGVGRGRFAIFAGENISPHNSFVQCWAETGLFGYFFWVGLIWATLQDGWAFITSKADGPEARRLKELSRAGIAALVGYMSAAFFLTRTFHHCPYILFGLFAAMRNIHMQQIEESAKYFQWSETKYVVALELISIPALWVLVRILN